MTLEAMQRHESVTLRYAKVDYRRQGVVQLALDHVSGQDILDLRCLEGDISVYLARQGRSVVALDGFSGAVELCNSLAKKSGLTGNIATLWNLTDIRKHVGQRMFDCVICLDLINHVESDKQLLTEIREVLKPGGKLVLLAPAYPSLLGKRDNSLGHLRRYTKKQLLTLLSEFGLTTAFCRYWNALALPGYVFVEKILNRMLTDDLRYRGVRPQSSIEGPLLRAWYQNVERRWSLPFGLSLFVVAERD